MIRPFDTGHERFSHRENNILVHICDPGRMNKYTETEIYPIYVFLHHLCQRLRFKEENLTALIKRMECFSSLIRDGGRIAA